MLFEMPRLNAREEVVVGRINDLRRDLSYAIAARVWTGSLRRMTFARGIQGSNSIEGYHVTIDDAIAAVEDEEPLEAERGAWAELTGYRRAMTYVLQLSDDPYFAYSRGLIRSLHYMMLQHDLAKHPGRWRPGPIFVRSDETGERVYEGPDAAVVNELMRELVDFLNRQADHQHELAVAAMAHLNLVMIHPFSDGNGRMGRALQTLVLARKGILSPVFASIEEYLGRNQRAYYDVLGEVGAGSWHPERDARLWLRFCLTAHFRQAATLARRARVLQRLWDALEHRSAELDLPDRTIAVLADAALGLKARNATYRRMAEVSDVVASRDLRHLASVGLLEPRGEKRGRYYVASESLRRMGEAAGAGETRKIPDPFDLDG